MDLICSSHFWLCENFHQALTRVDKLENILLSILKQVCNTALVVSSRTTWINDVLECFLNAARLCIIMIEFVQIISNGEYVCKFTEMKEVNQVINLVISINWEARYVNLLLSMIEFFVESMPEASNCVKPVINRLLIFLTDLFLSALETRMALLLWMRLFECAFAR